MKMTLNLTLENLSPDEAAQVLQTRVRAMLSGTVYVRPHFRQVPGWGKLSSEKRVKRIAKYALKLTKNKDEARKITRLPDTAFTSRRG